MDRNKQTQSAGDNAVQTIVGTATTNNNIYIVQGVSEERVRAIMLEIYEERSVHLIKEAQATASARVEELSNRVIPKMLEYDQKLEFLKDPSIQRAILTAQKSAICSDSKLDYEILSDLLMERIKNRKNRKASFAHEKAMEIIDQIPEEDLGLISLVTLLLHLNINPNNFNWWRFFITMSDLDMQFKKVREKCNLTSDYSWIETLESLSLLKSFPPGINEFFKFRDILTKKFPMLFSKGISKTDPRYEEFKNQTLSLGLLPDAILIDHPYIEGNVIVCWPMTVTDVEDGTVSQITPMRLNDSQRQFIAETEKAVNTQDAEDKSVQEAFMKIWNKYEGLKGLAEWWDKIPVGFQLTAIGRLIASTNLKITNKSLPHQ